MGKSSQLGLEIDTYAGKLFAGQILCGRIKLNLRRPRKIDCIKVSFYGNAHTSWNERETHRVSGLRGPTLDSHFVGDEIYFDHEETLYSNGAHLGGSGFPAMLQPGSHLFEFQFVIPRSCPSSLEGRNGHVRYLVTGRVERPWKLDQTVRRSLTVIGLCDLNIHPRASDPVAKRCIKDIRTLPWKGGQIECKALLPRQGYVPGDFLDMTLQVHNHTQKPIRGVQVALTQQVSYYAFFLGRSDHAHSRNENHRIASAKGQTVIAPGASVTIRYTDLKVPQNIPPTISDCELIKVRYFVDVQLNPKGLSFPFKLSLPIVVGSISVGDTDSFIQSLAMLVTDDADSLGGLPSYHEAASTSNGPPPSYNESTGAVIVTAF